MEHTRRVARVFAGEVIKVNMRSFLLDSPNPSLYYIGARYIDW